jgi:hypothetical protein
VSQKSFVPFVQLDDQRKPSNTTGRAAVPTVVVAARCSAGWLQSSVTYVARIRSPCVAIERR